MIEDDMKLHRPRVTAPVLQAWRRPATVSNMPMPRR
jgi:hypothetical protein